MENKCNKCGKNIPGINFLGIAKLYKCCNKVWLIIENKKYKIRSTNENKKRIRI